MFFPHITLIYSRIFSILLLLASIKTLKLHRFMQKLPETFQFKLQFEKS